MKALLSVMVVAAFAGCAHTPSRDFVQGHLRVTPPVRWKRAPASVIEDGGTAFGIFTDAEGRTFDFYVDHRIGTTTPNAIYLQAYPGDRKSVWGKDQAEFRQKLGLNDLP